MATNLPICSCEEAWGSHGSECPVRHEIETLRAEVAHIEAERVLWRDHTLRFEANGDRLRVGLLEMCDRLERCAIASGSAPEYAALATKRYRELAAEFPNTEARS